MSCDKDVLRHFYGDEGCNGTRSDVIKNLKDWAFLNKGHRIIIGSHMIGKNLTITYSLENLGVFYFSIDDKTDINIIDDIPSSLIQHLISQRNKIYGEKIADDFEDLLREKAKNVRNEKILQVKYLLLKDLIKHIRSMEPRLKIIFIYKSKSKLETELYDAFVDNECQFIFKIKVDKKEFFDEKSVTLDNIILDSEDLDLWPLSVEESGKMIRGEHPEVKNGICGITNDVVKTFFPKTKFSVEDLIIKIVGCHPYLLSVVCSGIIDKLNSPNFRKDPDIKQFLYNLIRKDSIKYDRFFKIFFCNIKKYRNDLYDAYEKWIKDKTKPEKSCIEEMKQFGMIFEKNEKKDEKIYIPFLFREYIIKGTTENFKKEIINNNSPPPPDKVNPSSTVKKILILSANPIDKTQKRLDEEIREINEGLLRAKQRDQFEIHPKFAVRLRDIRRALLDVEPHIVHFTGHGKEEGLWVEDKLGNAVLISTKALSRLFKQFSGKVQCVFLNSCYSARQATAINKHIDYVVGMRKEIKDESAIEFAVGFYDALGAGRSYKQAFELGLTAIPDQSEDMIPILKKK